jgi:hypothetical protein
MWHQAWQSTSRTIVYAELKLLSIITAGYTVTFPEVLQQSRKKQEVISGGNGEWRRLGEGRGIWWKGLR